MARRIGTAFREARTAQDMRQVDVAAAAGIAQPFYSRIERGLELGATLLTLSACAYALNVQLAAFVEALPGASLPHDLQHLRRQNLVITESAPGGWAAEPESALHDDGPRPRSIDVLLTRAARREAAVIEIWDLLLDGGAAMRGLEAKVLATRTRLGPEWTVQGLLVVRGTSRNRTLVRSLAALFAARYPASSSAWLRALREPDRPMPRADGLVWTDVRGGRLFPARLPP